mgnify:CR=1 FL=1|tara:strand:- start:838 stop:1182 length:345 start_codon:yes stop_codon:yes gene_type:complete
MDIEDKLEKASLLPNRYYIILKQGSQPDSFSVMAYDTNDGKEYTIKDIPAAMAVQHGLLSCLREDVHELFDRGIAEIAFKDVAESTLLSLENGEDLPLIGNSDNVIKVDFGKKQ